jgi:hypothetical protein
MLQLASFVIVAIVLTLVLRVILRRTLQHDQSDRVADTVMEPLAGLYGLLLAFLVSSVAGRATELRRALDIEAESIARLEQISAHLTPPADAQLRALLDRYVAAETAARSGTNDPATSGALLTSMWLSLAVLEPQRPHDSVLQSEALDELTVLREQRPIAARAHRHALGAPIWLVLGIGFVCIVGVSVIAGLGDPRASIYLVALTAVIVTTLYVLYVLSRPLLAVP